jgi:hypothetical protein
MRVGYTPLETVSVGCGATEYWLALAPRVRQAGVCSGRVVAVFDRVLYVSFETGVGEPPRVIAIGESRPGPLLTEVEMETRQSFDRLDISVGDRCRLQVTASDSSVLHLTVSGQIRLAVDPAVLTTLPVGQSLPGLSTEAFQRGAAGWRRHRELLEWLLASDRTDGISWLDTLDDYCAGRSSPKIEGLLRELRDATGTGGVCRWLVGRGPGATPAGDDVLCGLLVTARCNRRVRRVVGPAGRAIARSAVGQTPPISREMLRQASRGRAAEPTRESLRAVLSPETWGREPETILSPALGIGHTSGPALLAGMLTATLAVVPAVGNQ